jgi:hypothetical protein
LLTLESPEYVINPRLDRARIGAARVNMDRRRAPTLTSFGPPLLAPLATAAKTFAVGVPRV